MSGESRWGRKSVNCNGKQLAFYRKACGLTQSELATREGYSERLVRKAESGASVMGVVLRDLAAALSSPDSPISPEDLSSDPEQMAKILLHAFKQHEAEWVSQIRHLLSSQVTVRCAGDPAKIPFAGEWNGIDDVDRWVRIFFATMHHREKDYYNPRFITQGNMVVAWGEDWYRVRGVEFPPLWVSQRFVFERGQLVLLENLFDTDGGSAQLAEARARGMLNEEGEQA
ncbi:MAG: helix-turn-helix transcriptional regulator [Planctomycetales bacterium]|nr:helix-turn-helix transcriptional regulator [Planctomycetales bacterium]